jgi:hypothetical protein
MAMEIKRTFLTWLCKNWRKNKDTNYPQTWYYMPKNKRIRKILQFLCGMFGGHELSKTEWGFGGGDYADRWCRWCNKLIIVPKESVFFQFKDSGINPKSVMGLIDNKITQKEDV